MMFDQNTAPGLPNGQTSFDVFFTSTTCVLPVHNVVPLLLLPIPRISLAFRIRIPINIELQERNTHKIAVMLLNNVYFLG